jgi:hypothetical protein
MAQREEPSALRLGDEDRGQRGRARACVALARKLAGILYAMWRDGTEFDPQALRHGVAETAASA